MFLNENELVKKLVLDLQERFDTKYIVRELRSGNNIADIVYSTALDRKNIVFEDYSNAYYYFNEIYNHKKIPRKNIKITDESVNRKFNVFLKELECLGYIQFDKDNIISLKNVEPVTKNFVAIEAKVSDWKSGLEQAVRYRQYANEVYVALSSDYVKNVDRQLFRNLNVGLMSVSQDKLKISIKAKRRSAEIIDVNYYIADRFLKYLKMAEINL